jgi:putative glutamate/gamma-aminobutyrate antiporter
MSATTKPAESNAAASKIASPRKLGVFTLAMMNFTAVVSLRGLPAEAEYGLGSIFYYLFAAVFFLIPVSLVAAELATGWPQKGGVFRWVGEAFGPRWGFVAIFLQWVESTIWFPTVLTFAAVSLAFVGPNQRWDQALSANSTYVVAISLATYWAATLFNFRGIAIAGLISKWGGMIGTLIPGALIIVLGIGYMLAGGRSHMPLDTAALIPDLTNFNNLVLAASIFLFYAGMEMSAVHVTEVDNPGVNYPKAILIASLMTLAVFVLGTLAIGFIIPQSQINLTQSLLVAYDDFFRFFGLGFLSPVIAIMLAVGVFAGVATWVVGPSKGVLTVGRAGYLPTWLQHTNVQGVQTHILLVQGAIVTVLAVMFVVLPSVQAAYQILSQLTVTLYLIMYLLMFGAAIWLRYKEPNTPRTYRVPGGNLGMWIVAGAGFTGSLLAFLTSFIPPGQIAVGSPTVYVLVLIGGNALFVLLPLAIYALRRPSWKTPEGSADFEPFNWEKSDWKPTAEQHR